MTLFSIWLAGASASAAIFTFFDYETDRDEFVRSVALALVWPITWPGIVGYWLRKALS